MSKAAVGILTFNRSIEVQRAIDSVLPQMGEQDELIVADNNSSDNTEEVIKKNYPQVRYIKNTSNLGGPAGRNEIFKICKSDFIINLDDDGWLEEDAVEKVREAFDSDPALGVVVFRQRYPESGSGARQFEQAGREPAHFYEGVCAFRMEMLADVGLYPNDFFQYHEALDLGIRILDSKWKMISCPDVVMWHPKVGGGGANEDGRWDYYKFRNYLYVVIRRFPFPENIIFFLRKLGLYLFYALKHKTLHKFFAALRDVLKALPSCREYGKVSRQTVRKYYKVMKRVEREMFD
ncbi:glycosyltransferase family 2 protein [Sedimentisphaera salicampi]|uniref:Poly-beta-1,6-N-acetyl-D-glucosamine synthase n=1 Tax=Sedimentisphaera salicampi TaxID=1941349 RepID=A0A1W6LKV6_9BACT|nr:glycosyltransferase [Sedimentisphaera salicampi]ARN56395.1 Poly-beta-1,6-N-acetyl-D-glucosamine synthase [Sedimentisphaera salicampi]